MAQLDGYLNHKANVMARRQDDFIARPDMARVHLKATSHVAGNTGIRPVRMGEHTVVTDSAPALAGHSLGPSAPELLLGALASCLAHTYLLQAALLQISLDSVAVDIRGTLDMTGVVGLPCDRPITLEHIRYTPHITSPATPQELARLHAAVDAACAVLNTLRSPMEVVREDVLRELDTAG
jgi:uncharacterized OsmC-like protein